MNETSTPPAKLANTECLAILTSSYLVAKLDDIQKRALFRAVHALARRVAYKERAMRNKAARGEYHTPQEVADAVLADPPFVAPAPAPLSPDVPPMTEPSAPTPDAAETTTTNE